MAVIGRERERASVPEVTIWKDSSIATGRRSGRGVIGAVTGTSAAANAEHLRAEVGRETSYERAVEMREAEDAPATHTCAALEQVDTSAALIAIGGQLRVSKDPEFRHRPCKCSACRHHAAGRPHALVEQASYPRMRRGSTDARTGALDSRDGATVSAPAATSDR